MLASQELAREIGSDQPIPDLQGQPVDGSVIVKQLNTGVRNDHIQTAPLFACTIDRRPNVRFHTAVGRQHEALASRRSDLPSDIIKTGLVPSDETNPCAFCRQAKGG